MRECLEGRFTRFLKSLPHAEEIDALALAKETSGVRRADFFLASRSVILELKALTKDTSHKVDEEMNRQRDRDEFPLFYGERDLQKILDALPDGDEIHRRIYGAITRSVEQAVRSAEEQVSQTRELFRLPNSVGLLVILNESVEVLDPTVVASRVSQLLTRGRSGRSTAEKLDFVWLIFESHSVQGVGRLRAYPSVLIVGDGGVRYEWYDGFHADLQERWAKFNNAEQIDGGDDIADMRYASGKTAESPPPSHLPLHEVWWRQYRASPHLRALSDAGLLEFGGSLLSTMLPPLLTGGRGFDKQRDMPAMEVFTGFLEEMNFRGLDMKRVPRPAIPEGRD